MLLIILFIMIKNLSKRNFKTLLGLFLFDMMILGGNMKDFLKRTLQVALTLLVLVGISYLLDYKNT